jgi:hypothetical protein
MRAAAVVVGEVGRENPMEMALAKHDHMVEAVAADRADKPLRERVLPRRLQGCHHLLDAEGGDAAAELHPVQAAVLAGDRARLITLTKHGERGQV